jgi:hypothetical protein
MSEHDHEHKPHEITVHIDRKPYKTDQQSLTGEQLRQLAQPPIGADYDLYLEVPGGEDELIDDQQSVELKDGIHFFSSQKHITPGS